MNPADQAEYMKLHSHFENENSFGMIPEFLGLINTMDWDGKKVDEILKIIGIYVGNNFERYWFLKPVLLNRIASKGSNIEVSLRNQSSKPLPNHFPLPTLVLFIFIHL